MRVSQGTDLRVVACLPFDSIYGPCFALPLFADIAHPDLRLVQEADEYRDVIAAFRILEGEIGNALFVPAGPLARVGGEIVHAFISEDGILHIGPLAELGPVLRAFVARCPNWSTISLQIFELVGTTEERRSARGRMRRRVLDTTDGGAARAFYEGSVLRADLWSRLLAAANGADAALRILRARKKLGMTVSDDGTIKLDLSALNPDDYAGTNSLQLVEQLQNELRATTGLPQIEPSADAHSGEMFDTADEWLQSQRQAAESALRSIKIARRQEERLAILIDNILSDRIVGLRILETYAADRAKYATAVLNDLRAMLAKEQGDLRDRAVEIIKIARRHFAHGMPDSRAALFYFLVKHLAKYPQLKGYLRNSWHKSSSYAFAPYRQEIDKYLS